MLNMIDTFFCKSINSRDSGSNSGCACPGYQDNATCIESPGNPYWRERVSTIDLHTL